MVTVANTEKPSIPTGLAEGREGATVSVLHPVPERDREPMAPPAMTVVNSA